MAIWRMSRFARDELQFEFNQGVVGAASPR